MKKIAMSLIVMIIFTMLAMTVVFGTENTSILDNEVLTENSNAAEVTLKNYRTKEEKIAYYSEKYGDNVAGTVAYYIYIAQKYSIPLCFIGIVWGAFNCFVIGSKKLQKREQGFAMIKGFIIGLVVFQVIPLLYAILVAGR